MWHAQHATSLPDADLSCTCLLQFSEKTGLWAVTAMRWSFDKLTGYPHNMTEKKWLQRIVFLETVAGQTYKKPSKPFVCQCSYIVENVEF